MSDAEFFSPLTFDFLWEAMGVGEVPYPLRIRSHGQTEDERRALRERANAELMARGIRDTSGALEPHIEDWLTLLARPSVSIDAAHIPEFGAEPIGALAAADGRNAVLAVQDAEGIWIRPVFPEGLASSVVDLLPPCPRGTEASITLPLDEALRITPVKVASATGHGDQRRRPRASLSERTTDPKQAYAQLAGQPRLRGGQLAANSRNQLGGRQRSQVLAWFDTATGRYLSLSATGRDGSEWVTVAPADAKTLRSRVGELLVSVGGGR